MKLTIIFSLLFLTLSSNCQITPGPETDSIAWFFFQKREKSNKEIINKPFPAFTVLHNGDTIDNNYFKGKTVFINFWFEACPPCIAEFEALNEMYDRLKTERNFEFISFTFETNEKIEEIKNKYKIQYKAFSIEHEECYRLNNNNGFPTSMIIDSLGIIKYLISGGFDDKDKAKEYIMDTIYTEILKNLQ